MYRKIHFILRKLYIPDLLMLHWSRRKISHLNSFENVQVSSTILSSPQITSDISAVLANLYTYFLFSFSLSSFNPQFPKVERMKMSKSDEEEVDREDKLNSAFQFWNN